MADDEDETGGDEPERPFGQESFFAAARAYSEISEARPARVWPRRVLSILVVLALVVVAVIAEALTRPSTQGEVEDSIEPSGIAYCADFEQVLRNKVELGIEQMQRTSEGERLFDQLIEHEVCIGYADLPHNAGYTSMRGFFGSDTQIVLDKTVVLNLYADELAAVLVHEATHADRAFRGFNCFQTLDCEFLPNGIPLDEEVAAHLAEAKFWITIHGRDGTQSGSSWTGTFGSLYLNELAAVAQEGPEEFRSYVAEIRSSPHEGEGIEN